MYLNCYVIVLYFILIFIFYILLLNIKSMRRVLHVKLAPLWSLVEHRPIYYSLWTSVKYVSEQRPSFSSSFNYLDCL